MKNNTVETAAGVEVYENRIFELCDEYINTLDNPEWITKNPIFKGMLKYIYKSMFKPDRSSNNYINYNNKHSILDYSNITLLDCIWDIYTSLCYKYLQIPTLLNYCILTGIDNTTITSWINGEYRAGSTEEGERASSSHSQTAKRWKKECESGLVDHAGTGNPGAMFLLKCSHGYTEQPQHIVVSGAGIPQQTAAEIADKYAAATRPQLPDLE